MNHLRRVVLAVLLGAVAVAAWAQPPAAPDAVALVNGKPILRATLVERLEQTGGERVLADLIARQLITDAFEKSGLAVTEADVNAQITPIKAQAPDEAAWQGMLAQQGMTEADLRDAISFQLKLQKLCQKDVKPTDEALQQYFAEHAEAFGTPETVVLSEIVVTDQKQAAALRARLHKPGVDLATLAREHSLSPTKANGGRRPAESAAEIQPEGLASAVAKMKPKEISQPLAAENLWWIIRVEERQPARQADFAQVKELVRAQFIAANSPKVQDLVGELRAQAQVQINDPRYNKLKDAFGPQAMPPGGGGQ